jgi:hypothetical protein
MFARQSTFLALVAVFAVLGPMCGMLAAIACDEDCCCGQSRLADHCEPGLCVESQPAAIVQVAAQAPEQTASSMALSAGVATVVDSVSAEPSAWPVDVRLVHSPPDLCLAHSLLLI